MNIIKPSKLKKGDTIGILSVSGGVSGQNEINKAKEFLLAQGYRVKISDTTKKHFRYMAGTDRERAKVLENFFSDDTIDAILCSRGGYGALRIIDKIDYDIIKAHPKIFVGYSDITILLAMIYKKTKLITFHGAMAKGDFGQKTINRYTKNSFFNTLEKEQKEFTPKKDFETIRKGKAEGILWGGNLASLVSLAPLDFVPDEDIILFLEDLNEPIYKIDKMLTQLLNIPKLKKNIKGILFGDFLDNGNEEQLKELMKEVSDGLKVPSSYGYRITHGKEKDTLPYGIKAKFDSITGLVSVENGYLK
ncbi:LD-carboxypeptidase [bacterium]|nr:LD-carboxypeptidase [bacterium]